MIEALKTYEFLQNAFIAGILASIICGIMGVIIVEKKMIMMTGGIAHTAYGGVGLGYLLGFEPIIGAFAFAMLSALGIGHIKRKGGIQADILIGLFWSFGMALGILFLAKMPGYPPDMNSYLFGNILAVTHGDLLQMAILTAVVIITILALFTYVKGYLFDEEFIWILGVKTEVLEYILLLLIAITVVALIRVAGIILVISLLTAPAAIASFLSNKMKTRIFIAIGFGLFFSIAGLIISYYLNIPTGASIVLLAVSTYFVFYVFHNMREKAIQKQNV